MKHILIKLMLLGWLFPYFSVGFAQSNLKVNGKVVDAEGNALPGATVDLIREKTNKKLNFVADNEGLFILSPLVAGENYTVVAHHLGYKTDSLKHFIATATSKNTVLIRLKSNTGTIDEVVVIGYGSVQKKDLTGAISTVSGKDVQARKSTQLSQALQGAIPGVMVTRSNNAPGSTAQVRVRGITTITEGGMNPLIILDGVPIADMNAVNPNDVENITVLKDAASASIYGARAAAGVILITSKRGEYGKIALEYNGEYGFDRPTKLPDYVDAVRYLQLSNELRWNDNNNNNNEYPIYSKELIDNYRQNNQENSDQYPMTDWKRKILKNSAPRQTHLLSITGAGKTLRTRFSLGYDNMEGLYIDRSYKRITARVNNDIKINEIISSIIDVNFKRTLNNNPSIDPMYRIGITAPIYAAEWADGRIASGKDGDNIYGMLTQGGFKNYQYNQIAGKFALDIKPVEGLKLTGVFSPLLNFDKSKIFIKKVPYTAWDNPAQNIGFLNGYNQTKLNETRVESYEYTAQFLANYQKSLGHHNFNALGGYESYYYFNEDLAASRDQYLLTNYPYLNLGPLEFRDNGGGAYENAYRSYFGRLMYNYNNKYFVQANVRYDGSSRFAPQYRWGVFPSFSAGWTLTEENFLKGLSWVDFLKVRASYGTLGNERIGNYPYQALLRFENSSLFYKGKEVVSAQSAAQWQYAIRNISWEKTESFDVGLDYVGLNSRLNLTFDYYKKITNDMLLELQIPQYIGFDNPNQNTGKMYTKGWELALGWKDKVGDFSYGINVNLSDFKSVMGDLGGTEFLGDQIKIQGSQFNEWYGYISDGLYQTQDEVENSAVLNANVRPGDVRYRDISGPEGVPDGKISPEYDRVLLGGSLPRYMYGGTINLGFRNLSFSLVFQGVGSQNARLTKDMVQPYQENWGNFPLFLDGNAWSKYNTDEQNKNAHYPRYSNTSANNNYAMSDFWLFNGRYFRLKTIGINYNVPPSLLSRYKIKGLGISGTISDLFAANNYPKGWDPEMTSFAYPITTSFLLGVSLKF
ncbi:SusC/RagA family TonB-linked outer membrane protein [Sphingobacterium thalpophilum]|uniref:Outer membrane cobalamin receptor protein n=1 Tax=Sphingobacterium thalpophilum TaxID=259 RepID=A0A4U9VN65_9SPHI|nr:TonB-dependent receptor [Sphingobacterium thalpophilum]VTR44841.1 Outer membrane cobalamin receptor protein [Sphingobacterium thalpophilum]